MSRYSNRVGRVTSDQPPILDFDPTPTAIINPTMMHPPVPGFPKKAVITWMLDAFELCEQRLDPTLRQTFAIESVRTPIYEVEVDGEPLILALAMVGGAVSSLLVEALISMGCDTIAAVGSSGGLVRDLAPGTVVVPQQAIRDEGVSYHYAEASLVVDHQPGPQAALASTLSEAGFDVRRGTTWTTDAFYRETPDILASRTSQGAIAVDMESASLAAVTSFRNVRFAHAIYVADTLFGDEWDPTELVTADVEYRYNLLSATMRACAGL